ncbi:MAG TPA: cytochrome P450, partial [Thermosynechococcaceae cyanobacterium]
MVQKTLNLHPAKSIAPAVDAHYLWQIFQLATNPLEFFDIYAAKYGDCFTAKMGRSVDLAFFSHPEAIAEIFTAPPESFVVGPANEPMRPILGDTSLLLLDGQVHRQHRQLLMPPFHGDRLKGYGHAMTRIAQATTSHWVSGSYCDLFEELREISLRIILKTVFGLDQEEQIVAFRDLLDGIWSVSAPWIRFAQTYLPGVKWDWGDWTPAGRLLRLRQQIDQVIYATITERQQSQIETPDILNLLLSAKDESGSGLTQEEIRDELITLLLAGRDSVAAALSWMMLLVHTNSSVLETLVEEVRALGVDPD